MKLHILSCFILLYLLQQYNSATDTITPDQILRDGDLLVSSGGSFALGFFSPGSSAGYRYVGVWYNKLPQQTVVWVANRNNPINNTFGILSINLQLGNLVLHDNISQVSYWSANVSVPLSMNSSVQLLDTGNLVLFQDETKSVVAWQGFDYLSDTILPNMKLGIDLKTGLNRFITSWRSENDPADGDYQMKMEIDDAAAAPQIYVYKGSTKVWRTGSWNGIRLVGVPDMTSNFIFALDYVENDEEATFTYTMTDPTIYSRLMVNESGTADMLNWQGSEHQWVNFWSAPKEQCDNYNHCGPFGECNTNELAQYECSCLPGYEPKVQSEWSLRDAINGCIRMQGDPSCSTGEGFVKLTGLKVPDLSNARINRSLGLIECEQVCRKNCSCKGYANANVSSGGGGCITWYGDLIDTRQFPSGGQDFYIRVSASVLAEYTRKSKHRKVLIGTLTTSLSSLLLLMLVLWLVLKHRKRRRQETLMLANLKSPMSFGKDSGDILMDGGTGGANLTVYDLKSLAAATDNFSFINKLGEGGFGPVYKGRLSNGEEIAVKRLSRNSGQGVEEFKNEVSLIARLQHKNLVRLLGCCIQQQEKMLVYEHLPNKGLDNFIFDETKGRILNWRKRYEIMMGIARGMVYLHRDSRLKIIHRDLKASNILLDATLLPKISDFGMARIFGANQMEANTMRVVGTYGYMPPEYAMEGQFSEKSDVFSYGVLLLEIISGRRNGSYYTDDAGTRNLIGQVWNLWKEGKAMNMIDSSLEDLNSDETLEVNRCIHIGLLCVNEHPIDRPTMSEVLSMLSNETTLPAASLGQPAFVIRKDDKFMYSTSISERAISVDSAPITTIEKEPGYFDE